jgi:hypothetical protein
MSLHWAGNRANLFTHSAFFTRHTICQWMGVDFSPFPLLRRAKGLCEMEFVRSESQSLQFDESHHFGVETLDGLTVIIGAPFVIDATAGMGLKHCQSRALELRVLKGFVFSQSWEWRDARTRWESITIEAENRSEFPFRSLDRDRFLTSSVPQRRRK